MAKVLITEDYLSDIGDAIRGKLNVSSHYTPGQMASAIGRIPVVSPTLISKTISSNGTYNASEDEADGYDTVIVDVPEPVLIQKNITENGTYNPSSDNADGFSRVTVNVSGGGGGGTDFTGDAKELVASEYLHSDASSLLVNDIIFTAMAEEVTS